MVRAAYGGEGTKVIPAATKLAWTVPCPFYDWSLKTGTYIVLGYCGAREGEPCRNVPIAGRPWLSSHHWVRWKAAKEELKERVRLSTLIM